MGGAHADIFSADSVLVHRMCLIQFVGQDCVDCVDCVVTRHLDGWGLSVLSCLRLIMVSA